jgi:hypothetical protein
MFNHSVHECGCHGHGGFKEFTFYAEVLKKNKTERQVERLAAIADVVITPDRCTKDDVVVRADFSAGARTKFHIPGAWGKSTGITP